MQRCQIENFEGNAIPKIDVRLTSDQLQKLDEILEKIGIGKFQNGDNKSEKLRNFIEKLHNEYVLPNPVTVTSQKNEKPKIQRYCHRLENWVSIKEVCEKCRIATPQTYLNCPEILKEHGIK